MNVQEDVAIELEREKLDIEKRRLANEEKQTKSWRTLLSALATPLAILVTLVVAVGTIASEISQSNEQAEVDLRTRPRLRSP